MWSKKSYILAGSKGWIWCREICFLGSVDKIYEENVVENDLYSNTVNRMSFRNWYIWLLATRKFFRKYRLTLKGNGSI